jgi:hypothetical protein
MLLPKSLVSKLLLLGFTHSTVRQRWLSLTGAIEITRVFPMLPNSPGAIKVVHWSWAIKDGQRDTINEEWDFEDEDALLRRVIFLMEKYDDSN